MADRFVSGGTITSSGQVSHDESGHAAVVAAHREPLMKRSAAAEEWETVQHELEEERKRRERARADLAAEGQQSLYDVLQANKAAKQAAFEEQNKLKNQFRALDDDEIEFLDEVRAKEKAEEARAKKEVEEGLRVFRERQKSSGGGGAEIEGGGEKVEEGEKQQQQQEEEDWAVGGRKRKRHEREVLGVKKKAVGKSEEKTATKADGDDGTKETKAESKPPSEEKKKKKTGLGLVGYGSDDSDDDD